VGDGSYRLGAGDCSLCHGSARREKRELFSFKESELQPASDVVHDGLGVSHPLVAGPPRRFKPGVGHFAAEHFQWDAMLQRH
jgi:hypothetical protein